MELNLCNYFGEIIEFLSVETLVKIDYGILDLSNVEKTELREVFYFFEDLLTWALKANYLENNTGIFRVKLEGENLCYNEFGYVIESDSISDLKELVLDENRIWYVFDAVLASNIFENFI